MSHQRALIIVDLQNDFCHGSLPVPDGSAIIEPINKLMHDDWDLIVATKDWHPSNHISFASNHPGKAAFDSYTIESQKSSNDAAQFESTLWPTHCVQNTEGAELVSGLFNWKVTDIITKGEDPEVEFYSAFRDVFHHRYTKLYDLLQSKNIKHVTIVGLAFDFCVMHTALDAIDLGFDTSIRLNCTRAITKNGYNQAYRKLYESGVHLIASRS